jgi:predicted xylose isomerase-like sugar epimerase
MEVRNVSYAAVTRDPSANQVHAMAENTPVTLCGLEAADSFVVHEDFQSASAAMRCPGCDEAIAGKSA